jgi:hypothetical protein
MYEVFQIAKGPNKGMWAWKVEVPQKRAKNVFNKVYGKRTGIAIDEYRARLTAERQLRWHTKDATSEERIAA